MSKTILSDFEDVEQTAIEQCQLYEKLSAYQAWMQLMGAIDSQPKNTYFKIDES